MQCAFIPISKWKNYKVGANTIYLAETPCKRQQGLRDVKVLPANTLMLFPGIEYGSFFNTLGCLINLDIIPLTHDNQVLDVWTVTPGLHKIGPTPPRTAKVLEAPAGWCKSQKIVKGNRIFFLNIG